MVGIERHEPIYQRIEKAKALHLRETSKIDVTTLLLHIHHAPVTFLKFFHRFIVCIRMKDTFYIILFFLYKAMVSTLDIAILHQARHNITLNFLCVLIRIHAVEHLQSYLTNLLTTMRIVQ